MEQPRQDGKHDAPAEPEKGDRESNRDAPRAKLSRWVLLLALAIVLLGTAVWWLTSRNYESTDDAQIEGHLDLVSARISGTVSYINPNVENNQFVEAGTFLLELDPRDYQAKLEHARANLDTQKAETRSALVNVPIVDANSFGGLRSAEAVRKQALARVDVERAKLDAAQHKQRLDEALYARSLE